MREFLTASVVISTYTRAHLEGRAIHSVLSQTLQDRGLLLGDDGSADSTEEMVRGFVKLGVPIQHLRREIHSSGFAAVS